LTVVYKYQGASSSRPLKRCQSTCEADLAPLLRHYIPFIVALYPKVEKVTIRVKKDKKSVMWDDKTRTFAAIEYSLLPIFEKDLRDIASLKEIELHGDRKYDREGLEFVEEINKWLAEREAQRVRALGAAYP
jgi:hypothetical protein